MHVFASRLSAIRPWERMWFASGVEHDKELGRNIASGIRVWLIRTIVFNSNKGSVDAEKLYSTVIKGRLTLVMVFYSNKGSAHPYNGILKRLRFRSRKLWYSSYNACSAPS